MPDQNLTQNESNFLRDYFIRRWADAQGHDDYERTTRRWLRGDFGNSPYGAKPPDFLFDKPLWKSVPPSDIMRVMGLRQAADVADAASAVQPFVPPKMPRQFSRLLRRMGLEDTADFVDISRLLPSMLKPPKQFPQFAPPRRIMGEYNPDT